MKKIVIIVLLSVIYHNSDAQNYVLSPLGIKFPNYTNGTRPAANSLGAGTVLYNSTDNVLQFSQGSSWLNFGIPNGLVNQTLRNNGSGWVADGLMQNDGSRILIGLTNNDFDGLLRVNVGNGGTGVYVTSTDNPGIYAQSNTSSAVSGFSTLGNAIYGQSTAGAGLSGVSTNGPGISASSTNGVGISAYSATKEAIYATGVNHPAIFAISQQGDGIVTNGVASGINATSPNIAVNAASTNGIGVNSITTNGIGVYGYSSSNTGIYGVSASSYAGEFLGRLKIWKGGNGDAGIDFSNNYPNSNKEGFVGMFGNTEMMVWGYAYNAPIQRWNVNTGQICYATSPTICSDIRLKKEFKNLSNSLQSIASLKGYNYYLRNEKNTNLQTGFIAQEIQKVFPELVNKGSDGYLSVDYVGLIPHLVESVKSLKSENELLKERLSIIENFIHNSELKLEAKR